MDADKTVVANFVKKKYALTTAVEGEGTITEKIIKAGAATDYNSGTVVELTATGKTGWEFKEWTGDITGTDNPAQITVDKAKTVKAVFIKKQYPLTIEVEGEGTIKDAVVIYNYRLDRCYDPQSDPTCAGYVKPMPVLPEVVVYDALEDDAVDDATEETDSELYEKEKDEDTEDRDKDEEDEDRLELAMAASENALTIANTASQASVLQTMNNATNVNSYYVAQVPGGVYRESISLQGGEVVDNKKAFKSLSQDKLHNTMIREQYQ